MARSFASASSQRLRRDAAWATVAPITFSCFANRTTNVQMVFVGITSTTQAGANYLLSRAQLTGGNVDAGAAGSGSGATATVGSSVPALGAVGHYAAIFASSTSRTAGFNGALGSANTTSINPVSLDRLTIGVYFLDSANVYVNYTNGSIWEVGIWNAALDASEIKALAAGYSPPSIRPASLMAYYPLGGRGGANDLDRWKSKLDLTPDNSPTFAAHGRMIYPGDA